MKILFASVLLFVVQVRISSCITPRSSWSCVVGGSPSNDEQQDIDIYLSARRNGTILKRSAQGYVLFELFHRNELNGQIIYIGDTKRLNNIGFNFSLPTRFVTHGYLNDATSPSCIKIKKAFLDKEDCNVIVVDWWKMMSIWSTIPLDYWTTTKYIEIIGRHVAEMIDFLEKSGMNLKTTSLIGFSLGAHIMGSAGYYARNQVEYVVGLDPAEPMFKEYRPGYRISKEDAKHVTVVHTNEGNCGINQALGHYDFYPNGGDHQPGCESNLCSHSRVYEIYAESIKDSYGFYGRRCKDFASRKTGNCFGEIASMSILPPPTQGIYYLKTNSYPPYAKRFYLSELFSYNGIKSKNSIKTNLVNQS